VTPGISDQPLQSLSIEIRDTTGSNAATLKNLLVSQGFTQVNTTANTSQTAGVLVVFDTSLNQTTTDKVLSIVKSLYPNARSSQATVGSSTAIITIGTL